MLSENFDKKVRDAADHHHPTYDENAWKGMKKLLDKHLPEEEDDRRRIFFFLLLFLLLGGGAWYFFGRPSGKTAKGTETTIAAQPADNNQRINTAVVENKDEPVKPGNGQQEANHLTALVSGGENNNKDKRDIAVPAPSIPDPVAGISSSGSHAQKTKKQPGKSKQGNAVVPADITARDKTGNSDRPVAPVPGSVKPDAAKNDNATGDASPVVMQKEKEKVTPRPAATDNSAGKKPMEDTKVDKPVLTKAEDNTTPEAKQVVQNEKKTRQVSKRKSSFAISLSAGPDVSFTGNDGLGRMKFLGGAGVAYTYRNKFTLRTGFYSARKIYTSSPENYKAPGYFYTWYPNMERIEADCKVYEIPLNLSYHFSNSSKQSFFATAGLSTYLMKRETYDYYYKYMPTGPTLHREYSHYNENKHFFSVLNLGAGYQRSIGKRVSITAEPYFKLPLKGVGYGKVKLNSGGVLFSLSVKPFQEVQKK